MAVINIGSGSVKLHLFKTGKTEAVMTLLAGGLNNNTGLSASQNLNTAEDDTFNAVESFFYKAKSLGEDIFIFGTEAMRRQGGALAKKIRSTLGIEVDIIDGQTEALCGFLGAANGQTRTVVIDVGGASTEVSAGISRPDFCLSVPIGSVSLYSYFGISHKDSRDVDAFLQGLYAHIRNCLTRGGLSTALPLVSFAEVTLIGGSAHNLSALSGAQILQKMLGENSCENTGDTIRTEQINKIVRDLFIMTKEQRTNRYPFLEPKRALVLPYGISVIYNVLQLLSAPFSTVSKSGLIEGYIKYKNIK